MKKFMKKFIVKNVSMQKKSVKVFGFSIPYQASVDLLKLSYVKNIDVEKSLIKGGELFVKIKNKDLVVIEDSIVVNTNTLPKVIINDNNVYPKIVVQENVVDENTFSTVHDEAVPYTIVDNFIFPNTVIETNVIMEDVEEDKDSFINLLDVEPEVEDMVISNKVPKLNKSIKQKLKNKKSKK
jgi:hypothetical protein